MCLQDFDVLVNLKRLLVQSGLVAELSLASDPVLGSAGFKLVPLPQEGESESGNTLQIFC